MSRWYNPTDFTLKGKLVDGYGVTREIRVAPRDVVNVPDELDYAIREERNGLVLGILPHAIRLAEGEPIPSAPVAQGPADPSPVAPAVAEPPAAPPSPPVAPLGGQPLPPGPEAEAAPKKGRG